MALIVAAGRGSRAGGGVPKQYRGLGGRAVLRWSLERFRGHARVSAVRVVIHPDDRARYDDAARGLELLDPVGGGVTRQESVRLGLESLSGLAPASVLIHDAARPFVDDGTIDRTLDALAHAPGAIAAVPVADTIKRGDSGRIAGTIDRNGLFRAQTPQGFRYADILAAHRAAAGAELSDDAAVAERAGLAVLLVGGSEMNAKITSENDLQRAALIAGAAFETRVGSGFDVHAFGPGDHVWLCGVRVPHTHALIGHSDADAGLHALTDAILGAIGEGDIGMHFPPNDPRWRGASSDKFLAHARSLLAARGGALVHADVTIICERPKVGPHRAEMAVRLAAILGVDARRCSVKATTTEGLGFTGRGEGIAAQAIATVRLPV